MLEKLTPRDRLALKVAGVALVLFLVADFGVLPFFDILQASSGGIEKKELTLRRYQRLVALASSQPNLRAAAEKSLGDAEAGLLESPSESLANAEWQRLVRELAKEKGLELTSSEVLRAEKLSPNYALVTGRVAMSARIDQLVDMLVAMATSPKLLATSNLKITSVGGGPQKLLMVDMTISAAMHTPKAAPGAPEKH